MDNMTLHALLLKAMSVSTASPQISMGMPPMEPTKLDLMEKPVEQKRCGFHTACKKKLALSDLLCSKCNLRFCGQHRQPELHACPHDYKSEGKELLAKQNPRVVADKVGRI